ncbi:MAG TPA: PAS domain-containing sensor histidine kinase [Dehalococcoidales bacterium]|nr:PAS domain-containing sensor histidine kinase [Dehalococcoidales bacterium]
MSNYFQKLKKALSGPHVWILLAGLIVCAIFEYPDQILHVKSVSLLAFIGLSHYSMERAMLLAPVIYAGMVLGMRAGITTLVLSMSVILPRLLITADYRAEGILETVGIIILGVLANLFFQGKRKEKELHRQLMTRLEETEQGMSASEQKYRYLFENASDAIWVQDVNGMFLDGNRAFEGLSGFAVDELKGIHLGKFLRGDSLVLARNVRNKLISGQQFEQPYEQQFFVKNGSIKIVMMSTTAVMSRGMIQGFEHVARDITAEKQQQENVQAYIQQITMAQEEERKRISRDLHDDVSPDILILIQKLDNLAGTPRLKVTTVKEKLQELRGQAVVALEALRATAQGLRPRILDDLGLVAALEWIGEELEKDQKIKVAVETSGLERPLTPEARIVLFRIAQEALNNIRKHSHAAMVNIRLKGVADSVRMTISDNGQGFEVPDRAEEMVSAGRLGLMGMYERARLLDGNLEIKSTPGRGTELTVTLPGAWLQKTPA